MRALPSDLLAAIRSGGCDLAILVIRLGAFGDILRTLPPVRLLRRQAPDARIDWVMDDRWSSFFEGHPDLSAVVPFPRKPAGLARVRAASRCLARLRAGRYDLALDFHGNLRSGIVGLAAGARVRLGYDGHQQKEGNHLFTTHRVAAGERRVSRMERNLDLVRALGLPTEPLPDGGLPSAEAERRRVLEMRRATVGTEAYAILSPGASRGQAYKRPPLALLAAAAAELARADITPLIVYGPGEEAQARGLVRAAAPRARLAPATTLAELAELLREARVFVGGDSGPLHLACAVGCPVVALYGPTDPRVNEPWGVPFVVVAPPGRAYTGIKKVDRAAGGFSGLEPAMIASAVRALLRTSAASRRNDRA